MKVGLKLHALNSKRTGRERKRERREMGGVRRVLKTNLAAWEGGQVRENREEERGEEGAENEFSSMRRRREGRRVLKTKGQGEGERGASWERREVNEGGWERCSKRERETETDRQTGRAFGSADSKP
jgi:hypothetical protein